MVLCSASSEEVRWHGVVRLPDGSAYTVEKVGRWEGPVTKETAEERRMAQAPPPVVGWAEGVEGQRQHLVLDQVKRGALEAPSGPEPGPGRMEW